MAAPHNHCGNRRPRRLRRVATAAFGTVAAALISALTGCVSYSYLDDQKIQHVIGFVDLAIIPAGPPPADPAPKLDSISAIGLSAYSNPDGGGVALGYTRETFLILPGNSCIDIGAPGPCAAPSVQSPVNPIPGAKQQ
jgi:hypothetical protein